MAHNEFHIEFSTLSNATAVNTGTAADSGDTLVSTTSANATSFTATSLSAETTYYWAVYAFNGTSLSTVLQGSQQTDVATAWTTVPADFTLDADEGGTTFTSDNKAYVLAGASGNTTFTFVKQSGDTLYNPQFAAGTSSNPTNWSNPGTTITLSAGTNYYVKVRHDWRAIFLFNEAVYRVTATNNSTGDTMDVTMRLLDT